MNKTTFLRHVRDGTPITPPVTVRGFTASDIPGGYRAYVGGSYSINDPKYGSAGTKHLRPRTTSANPWSIAIGGGVLLENYNSWGSEGYKIDIAITRSAKGHVVLRGVWAQATVIRDNRGNLTFGQWSNVETRIEFDVADLNAPPPPPTTPFTVTAPSGVFSRPTSGGLTLGEVRMSPVLSTREMIVDPPTSDIARNAQGGGVYKPSISSRSPLGVFRLGIRALHNGQWVSVYGEGEVEIVSATGTPEPPPPPPDYPDVPLPPLPPPPPPAEPEKPTIQTDTTETTAFGDEDGAVQWAVVNRMDNRGTGSIEAEALPRRVITDYLPAPKVFRPIQKRSLKRSITVEDVQSIEELGEQQKRVRFAGVNSWGAIQQYAESALVDAARCVQGMASIPCNPMMRAGDVVNYNGHVWHVERAQHNFSDWTTHLTMRRVPSGAEISGVFFSSPNTAETAIVRVIKNATGRVNNAVEATVTSKIDNRTYLVRIMGQDEEIEVKADHVIFGDLVAGGSILIGRGTK